ncbi:MAG: alpha/beta family hydrolase [Actinomycetes bacterium]
MVLGHGAGGGIDAADLTVATRAALAARWCVARVLQPYRMAGRRAPAPAARLDAAWLDVVADLRNRRELRGLPTVVGGRSSGARVACRTAGATSAGAIVGLAFPLHPPGRPERSRAEELRSAAAPVYVVQGERDAFGSAADLVALRIGNVRVCAVAGADHALRGPAAAAAVADVVTEVLGSVG